jgi:hypothetical protein
LAIWGCQGIPLILAYIILANSDSINKKHNRHNKFSGFYYGEFLKIAILGQNYISARKTGFTVRYIEAQLILHQNYVNVSSNGIKVAGTQNQTFTHN